MRDGLKIIIQLQLSDGSNRCRGFTGLNFATPALIVIVGIGQDASTAEAVERQVIAAIADLSGQAEHSNMPCRNASLPLLECHAHEVKSCRKLLVIIGDKSTRIAHNGLIAEWNQRRQRDDSYQILPVLPLGSDADTLLPAELRDLNACFFEDVQQHVIPHVLSKAGITPEDYRLFISYKRSDTSALADQLFNVLSAAGFDVFLDRYCLAPGVAFQQYLAQELADKSMLLLLESNQVVTSNWVKWEIALAKKYDMGLLALHPTKAPTHPDVDSNRRRELDDPDPAKSGMITEALAQKVVLWVREAHNSALHKRRNKLRQNLIGEAIRQGLSVDSNAPQGYLKLRANGTSSPEYRAWLTSRPAQFDDFHYTDSECVGNSGARGLVMAPMPHPMTFRQDKIEWLARSSGIRFSDEGQLIHAVAKIARGVL